MGELDKTDSGPWLSHYRVRHSTDRLEEATVGLRLAARRRFFPKNTMRLRCTATLGALQWHVQSWSVLNVVAAANTSRGWLHYNSLENIAPHSICINMIHL